MPDEIPDNLELRVDDNGNLYYLEIYPEEFSSLQEYEEYTSNIWFQTHMKQIRLCGILMSLYILRYWLPRKKQEHFQAAYA